MARRLVLRLVAFSVCALTTINIYLYLSQSVCYTARNETEELWEITEEPAGPGHVGTAGRRGSNTL